MPVSLILEIKDKKRIRTTQGTQRNLPTQAAPLSFADNDYLGLSRHPRVAEAAILAIRESGTGARAARHLAGSCPEHARLESELADWKKTDSALAFASGYQTPLGVIPSLVGPKDTILLERNAHACLFDGARLSNARLRLFARNDPSSLEEALTSAAKLNADRKILVVAESLHSMEGDFAELSHLVELKNRFGAWLLLDEAHANGVVGPQGSGWAADQGLSSGIDIHMGTLGKALGSSGGFVAASAPIIDHFLNEARTFLFGTAPAPAAMAAAGESLRILRSPEGDHLRKRLQENIELHASNQRSLHKGPIQPEILHSNEAVIRARDILLTRGIEVAAIRPPTVPEGTARLRISLSARHTMEDIQKLGAELSRLPTA